MGRGGVRARRGRGGRVGERAGGRGRAARLREEVGLAAEDLRRERGLGDREGDLAAHLVGLDGELVLDELDRLLHRHPVARHHRRRVYAVLHQLVRALQQLGGEDDDRGGAVAHLLVLHLRELHEDARRRVLDLELVEDRRAVVRDRHLAQVVDEHLVETDRAERRLDDVRHRERRRHVLRPHVLPRRALAGEVELVLCRHRAKEEKNCAGAGARGVGGGCREACGSAASRGAWRRSARKIALQRRVARGVRAAAIVGYSRPGGARVECGFGRPQR